MIIRPLLCQKIPYLLSVNTPDLGPDCISTRVREMSVSVCMCASAHDYVCSMVITTFFLVIYNRLNFLEILHIFQPYLKSTSSHLTYLVKIIRVDSSCIIFN